MSSTPVFLSFSPSTEHLASDQISDFKFVDKYGNSDTCQVSLFGWIRFYIIEL